MASTAELVEAIYRLIASSPTPIPITLMNHGVDETAAIIGAIVERCAQGNIALVKIFIDPELAEFLGLENGGPLPHGSRPTVRCKAAKESKAPRLKVSAGGSWRNGRIGKSTY
jgi:hypothetical protein